jgi:cytoplasmic FMR1 interacting protein
MAYQSIAGLHRDFFGLPHMIAVIKVVGSRSLPGILRALLDHISTKVLFGTWKS